MADTVGIDIQTPESRVQYLNGSATCFKWDQNIYLSIRVNIILNPIFFDRNWKITSKELYSWTSNWVSFEGDMKRSTALNGKASLHWLSSRNMSC